MFHFNLIQFHFLLFIRPRRKYFKCRDIYMIINKLSTSGRSKIYFRNDFSRHCMSNNVGNLFDSILFLRKVSFKSKVRAQKMQAVSDAIYSKICRWKEMHFCGEIHFLFSFLFCKTKTKNRKLNYFKMAKMKMSIQCVCDQIGTTFFHENLLEV